MKTKNKNKECWKVLSPNTIPVSRGTMRPLSLYIITTHFHVEYPVLFVEHTWNHGFKMIPFSSVMERSEGTNSFKLCRA